MADPLDQYDETFRAAGQEWNVDWRALKAIAAQESRGDPGAVSKAGARGLMQIMPDTGKGLGMTDLHDPVQSIYGAAKYMNQALTAEHDNPQAALLFYHGGPQWRSKYGPESQGYVPAVTGHYQRYAKASTGTATDATPAPAEGTVAQKKPDDDPFTRALNAPASEQKVPAVSAGTTPAAPAKAEEPDAFTKALQAPPAATTEASTTTTGVGIGGAPAESAADTVKRLFGLGGTPAPSSPLAEAITSPDAQAADRPAGSVPLTQSEVVNALAPAPDTTYGEMPLSWVAKDDKTGAFRFAMPSSIRETLLDFARGTVGAETMVNPETGQIQYGMTPGANALLGFGAGGLGGRDMRFSGANPFVREPPGLVTKPLPVTVNELTSAIGRADREPISLPTSPPPVLPTGANAVDGPQPGMGGRGAGSSAPLPAGAQVSPTSVVGISPEQEAIYRSTAEGQKWLEPQPVNVPDRNQYVRGVNPNLAEQEQTVATARELKSLGITSTEVSQEAKQIAQDHNEARSQHFSEISGTGHDILARETKRETDIEKAKPEVFKHSRAGTPGYEADASAVVAHIKKVMSEPANLESPAVQQSLGYVLKRLVDDQGNLRITNPEQLWGLRQQLDRMTGKRMQSDDSNLHYAAGQLNEIKPLLDAAIEPVAPGFTEMLATYKGHSQAIEGMRLLQDYRNSLYAGSGGNMRMTFEKVSKMMRDIVDARDPNLNQGVNPYQSITEEQMAKLWALRDDLRRSASALELARTPGSDSVQNLWDMVRGLATGPEAQAALHASVAGMFGAPGVVISGLGQRFLAPILAGRTAAKQTTRGLEMLRPPNPLNSLAPP